MICCDSSAEQLNFRVDYIENIPFLYLRKDLLDNLERTYSYPLKDFSQKSHEMGYQNRPIMPGSVIWDALLSQIKWFLGAIKMNFYLPLLQLEIILVV